MFEDLACHPTRFRLGVKRLVITDTTAARVRRPKLLSFALEIVAYHCAGDVENCLRRAIVLFEPDDSRVWKMLLEIQDIGDVCAAPFVN